MALYTIFAWTAIVIAGAAYYWIYIRQAPLPAHLLGLSSKPHSRESTAEGNALSSPQKRKRKVASTKKRPVVAQTNELVAGTIGISGDESDEGAKSHVVQDERGGVVEPKSLKLDTEPPRKQVKRETHFTPSDADESDALDTPTPAPTKKQPSANLPFDSLSTHTKNAAETRFDKVTPKTSVDDMIPQEDRPAVARVMRISSPSNDTTTTPSRPPKPRTESAGSGGPAVDKDGLTKKQRQNQKKKERHREAKAREEAIRQSQLRAHQKELETIRLNSQIKAAEKKSAAGAAVPINAWQQTGRPNVDQPPAMDDSVYTIRNLSEENLTTLGHRSDGAASEEGWQEVTSRAAKKAAAAAAAASSSSQKATSGTEGSEEVSSSVGDSEEGSVLKVRPAYVSNNTFANLDS